MNEDRNGEGPEEPAASVLGSLPQERPGTRSPRREAAASAEPTEALENEEAAAARGVDDLAWAGIAIAAEAATLGVRLANRAIETMRGAVERP